MSTKMKSFYNRFLKGFVASGMVMVVAELHAGVSIHSFSDVKQYGISLAVAFFTGVLLAAEKMLSWTPTTLPATPSNEITSM